MKKAVGKNMQPDILAERRAINKSVAQTILKVRQTLGLSREVVAQKLGITVQKLTRYECADLYIPPSCFLNFALLFGPQYFGDCAPNDR